MWFLAWWFVHQGCTHRGVVLCLQRSVSPGRGKLSRIKTPDAVPEYGIHEKMVDAVLSTCNGLSFGCKKEGDADRLQH